MSTSDGVTNFNGVYELVFPPGSVVINGRTARIGVGGSGGVPGSGISSLNGMLGGIQTFSRTNDTNVNLTIASSSNNHSFTLSWSGALGKSRQHAATVYTDQANTFGAFLQKFQAGNNFNLVDPSDTTKAAKFDLSNLSTATTRTVNVPDANSTTAQPKSSTSHQWLTSMSAQGVFASSQPDVSDVTNAELALTSISPIAPTFQNSWVNFGGSYVVAGYWKDRGQVCLEGLVKNGTINTTIFTLPAGYRSAGSLKFIILDTGNPVQLQVDSDGQVYQVGGAGTSFVSLAGVCFRQAN